MMHKRMTILSLALLALFSLTLTALAQSGILEIAGGENYQITCNGSKLVLQQQSATKGTANCEAEQAPTGPSVTQFILVNADNNRDLGPLTDNATLNLANMPSKLNIRAETNPSTVGSVKFQLNGADHSVENLKPYAFAGDNRGNYNPWTPAAGQFTITAIAFSQRDAKGTAGSPLTVNFSVVSNGGPATPVATNTPAPNPTNTPVNTPGPNPTNTPVATPTSGPISGVPLCPDHDPTKWHGLYDAARKCRYNHEHKADPSLVNNVFGPVGALYGGQSISYPWNTPNENVIKHEGYGWIVARNVTDPDFCKNSEANHCITDFRVQYHAIPSALGAVTRFHSYWGEVRVCNGGKCGTIKSGGWQDFGRLMLNDSTQISVPDDKLRPFPGGNKRRIHFDDPNPVGGKSTFTWYGFGSLSIGIHGESWGWVDRNNPTQLNLFCPDARCQFNASRIKMHILDFKVPSQLDQDGDGIVNYKGWTNRYGDVVNNCSAPGLDCVPYVLENVPVGYYQYRNDKFIEDYDTSPNGQYWIGYPN
ncbi:MAG: hypothetical protein KDI79_27020 [Anaerolineae bacterium]|nr:hypothetical protein [Anaerolineae bacterium]